MENISGVVPLVKFLNLENGKRVGGGGVMFRLYKAGFFDFLFAQSHRGDVVIDVLNESRSEIIENPERSIDILEKRLDEWKFAIEMHRKRHQLRFAV